MRSDVDDHILKTVTNPNGVRFVTLNCWGLKFVSKKRAERLLAIARQLKETASQYDIVALQEVWVEEDYQQLLRATQSELPYAKRWYSGMLTGPGLVVFSRWPIVSSWIHRFPLNGRPSAFHRGDWFVGKSAGSCTVAHPSGTNLEIIVAHLHAPYAPSGDAAYECHRASQAWDLSQIVARASNSRHATFVVGDLNAAPGSVNYRLFEKAGRLSDAWISVHGNENSTPAKISSLSPADQISIAGVTCDSQLNTWRAHYPIDKAKRLDYVLYDHRGAKPKHCQVVFTEPVAGIGSLSDHFGLYVSFDLGSYGDDKISTEREPGDEELIQVYDDVLELIADYWPTNQWQSTWRILHFYASLLVLVGLLVAVWWGAAHNRAYVGFIFMAVAIIVAVTGFINGLIGFLFGRNEKRALIEFENQIKMARRRLA